MMSYLLTEAGFLPILLLLHSGAGALPFRFSSVLISYYHKKGSTVDSNVPPGIGDFIGGYLNPPSAELSLRYRL